MVSTKQQASANEPSSYMGPNRHKQQLATTYRDNFNTGCNYLPTYLIQKSNLFNPTIEYVCGIGTT